MGIYHCTCVYYYDYKKLAKLLLWVWVLEEEKWWGGQCIIPAQLINWKSNYTTVKSLIF